MRYSLRNRGPVRWGAFQRGLEESAEIFVLQNVLQHLEAGCGGGLGGESGVLFVGCFAGSPKKLLESVETGSHEFRRQPMFDLAALNSPLTDDLSWGDDVDSAVHSLPETPPLAQIPPFKIVVEGVGRVDLSMPKRRRLSQRGFRVTQRDADVASMLSRYRYCSTFQVARRFETTMTAMYGRLPRLREQGFLVTVPGFQHRANLWMVTAEGSKLLAEAPDLPVTPTRIGFGHFLHTSCVTDLGTSLELKGFKVITDREIRSAAAKRLRIGAARSKKSDPYGLRVASPAAIRDHIVTRLIVDGVSPEHAWGEEKTVGEIVTESFVVPSSLGTIGGPGHIPDLVVVQPPAADGSSRSIACEVEVSGKSGADYEKIIRDYMASPAFAGLNFYATSDRVGREINKAVRSVLGASSFVTVEKFTPIDISALPLPLR